MDVTDFAQVARSLDRQTEAMLSGRTTRPLATFKLDLLAEKPPAPRDWFLPGFIPKGEVTLFTGPGGAGKSLAAQQLATCLAARKPFLGLDGSAAFYEDYEGVLYVTCEDDERELHRRQHNIMEATGTTRADLSDGHGSDRLHLVSLRGSLGTELATFDREGNLEKSDTFDRLFDTLFETSADLVILDNVAHLFTGNENDRGHVTRFVNLLYSLVRNLSVTVILIGHPNKSGDNYSGSTAWLNAVRSHIAIDYQREADGSIVDRDARVLTVSKANYARTGAELAFRWHNWAFVTDADLPPDARAELSEAIKASGENEALRRCLAATADQKRAVSHHPGVNYYASVFTKMPEGKRYTKAAFERAFERLLSLGEIEIDVQLWQRQNRAWKYGIRLVESAPTPLHQPPAPTRTELSAKPARTDPPISKDIPGAATWAAAPDVDDLDWSDGEPIDD